MSSLEVREMSWPDFFDECRRYGQMALPPHGIAFSLAETGYIEQPGPGVFPGLSLLRVIKEALTNTVKHACCTRVGVLAEFAPHQVRLTVRDNGRGLPAGPANGRGLRNMAARIHELNGTMGCRNHDGLELVFEISLPVTLVDSPPEVPA
jgi:signal transduction histidine kinase